MAMVNSARKNIRMIGARFQGSKFRFGFTSTTTPHPHPLPRFPTVDPSRFRRLAVRRTSGEAILELQF